MVSDGLMRSQLMIQTEFGVATVYGDSVLCGRVFFSGLVLPDQCLSHASVTKLPAVPSKQGALGRRPLAPFDESFCFDAEGRPSKAGHSTMANGQEKAPVRHPC
jgi:hypothetical protein